MRWTDRAVAACVSGVVAVGPALAQAPGTVPATAPAPAPALGQVPALRTLQPAGDPPARVGRVAAVSGTVSFHLAGADRWDAATVNLPVTTGSVFWTEPGAAATLDVPSTRMGMDQSTEVDIVLLDDRTLNATLPQGRVCVNVRSLAPNETATVQTPRSLVSLMKPGLYAVAAGDVEHPTVATVLSGEADLSGTGVQAHATANQAVTITGDGQQSPFQAAVGPAQKDAFLQACEAADRPARPRPATVQVPADVARMTGGAVLDEYGDWATTPEYGAIWYPPADPGYVPYRHGHWGYVAPWGWTWVDDAPWGFAPSHYGRWVEVQDRWGWIPGGGPGAAPQYPVYAPAVVSFLAGAAVGAAVGWVPLGPREPYYPPYRVSPTYVRNVNITHVSNVTTVVNTYNTTINRGPAGGLARPFPMGPLANRGAATSVPVAAMVGSQGLAQVARPFAVAPNQAVVARPPMGPTGATLGVTPAVARQFNVPLAAGRPSAPGPALRTGGPGPAGGPERAGGPGGGLGPGSAPGPAGGPERAPNGPEGAGRPGPGAAAVGGALVGGALVGGAAGAMMRREEGRPNPGGPAPGRPGAPGPAGRPINEGPRGPEAIRPGAPPRMAPQEPRPGPMPNAGRPDRVMEAPRRMAPPEARPGPMPGAPPAMERQAPPARMQPPPRMQAPPRGPEGPPPAMHQGGPPMHAPQAAPPPRPQPGPQAGPPRGAPHEGGHGPREPGRP